MTQREEQQLDKILKLDAEMKSVDFTVAVIDALIADMTEDMHRVDMQRALDAIMQSAYGGAE